MSCLEWPKVYNANIALEAHVALGVEKGSTMPLTIILVHFINLFAMILLIRSGLHIAADHPFLYWTDDTRRDNYWIKFGKKQMPTDRLWTAHDEFEPIGHWALPGGTHHEFGIARNWHFSAAIIWVVTGIWYWAYMFVTGTWRNLIPTDSSVFSKAWHDFLGYITLQRPPLSAFDPYDPLQQLAYAFVSFPLPILMILTAAAMSPAFANAHPRFMKLFGGRHQVARTLHFLGMVTFSGFIIMHILMVILVYFPRDIRLITLGSTDVSLGAALAVLTIALLFLVVFNIVITHVSLNHRVGTRRVLMSVVNPVIHAFFGRMVPVQTYSKNDVSEFFRVNGYPPETDDYHGLAEQAFQDWRLQIGGEVAKPASLSLDELHAMPYHEQITKHVCIQGWTAVAQWGGVHMRDIVDLVQPDAGAQYVVFHAYDEDGAGKHFYEAVRLSDMQDPLTMLAFDMNWKPLDIPHGAPLRLRCERKLGFKMVKYIRAIEFVSSFEHIGEGRGGYREDSIMFDWEASL